jgi:8-oxo-dGTP diphosphatase
VSGPFGTRGTRLVVAGILVKEGRLLMSRRPAGGAWPGLWELPGGKAEAGETPEQALAREWREELDVTPLGPVPYDFATEDNVVPGGGRGHLTLLFFRVRGLIGTPRAKGVDAVRWCPADEARILPTPPADAPVLARLAAEGGGSFRDTGDAEGRALAEDHAATDPFIERSEVLGKAGALTFVKSSPTKRGDVRGLLVATPDGARAFRNVCPHVPIPLDRDGEPLLSADGLFLVCRNHGALFTPEDGLCVAGPCEGESLVPLRVVKSGAGWALDAWRTR